MEVVQKKLFKFIHSFFSGPFKTFTSFGWLCGAPFSSFASKEISFTPLPELFKPKDILSEPFAHFFGKIEFVEEKRFALTFYSPVEQSITKIVLPFMLKECEILFGMMDGISFLVSLFSFYSFTFSSNRNNFCLWSNGSFIFRGKYENQPSAQGLLIFNFLLYNQL